MYRTNRARPSADIVSQMWDISFRHYIIFYAVCDKFPYAGSIAFMIRSWFSCVVCLAPYGDVDNSCENIHFSQVVVSGRPTALIVCLHNLSSTQTEFPSLIY